MGEMQPHNPMRRLAEALRCCHSIALCSLMLHPHSQGCVSPQCFDEGAIKVRSWIGVVETSAAPAFPAGALVEAAQYGLATSTDVPAGSLPIQRQHMYTASQVGIVHLLACASVMGRDSYHAAVWLLLPSILLAASGCLAAGNGIRTTSATSGRSGSRKASGHKMRALLVVGGRNDPEVRARTHALMCYPSMCNHCIAATAACCAAPDAKQ